MPNTYIKAPKYAALAVAALQYRTVLPMAFTRMAGDAFIGAEDDTVTFKLPGVTQARDYEWRTRTNPIVLDKIGRTKVSISIDTHTYSAVPITDEELTMDLESFTEEVLDPQMTAVVDRLEGKVMAGLRAAPFNITDLNAAAADDPFKWGLSVKRRLNQQHTPAQGRKLLVGANVAEWIGASDSLVKYDSAQALTAYREATLGRLAGMDIVESDRLGDNEIFAVHPSALIVANLAPGNPEGATYSARRTSGGFSMRVLRDYDPNFLRDRSVVSTFSGVASVNDQYQTDANGLVLDADGNPVITGKNVRGAKGTFTPAA